MDYHSSWTLVHARLHQTLRKRQLLPKQAKILIALSGGQDSLCLSKLLLDLQSKWQWQIAIAHCDHRWSSDTGITEHVQQIVQTWNVPFYLQVAESLSETEAAARVWRYQALTEIAEAQGLQYVVTGHTKSDRAETLLYNLVRGAGADGLSALTWQRPLTSAITLVRPILNFTRRETFDFCQQFQLPIWFDVANHNLKYARNRIRADLIPYLQTNFNFRVENSLAQTAELLRADVEYLEETARQCFNQAISPTGNQLNRIILKNLPLALQRRVIRQYLTLLIGKAANFEQIEAVRDLISAPNRTRTSTLSGNVVVEVIEDWLVLQKINQN
ncbi:tRNA(Ile)-lysidine synthetase [Stanieria sp. NIES-3757]|nr:tRNA(Ile)-lysidine synthetase [Stanieria sp. NIES-3757]